jgi:hypothetical protein
MDSAAQCLRQKFPWRKGFEGNRMPELVQKNKWLMMLGFFDKSLVQVQLFKIIKK